MNGVCIADLHINAIPIENLNKELPLFINTLDKMENLDIIVFCGDLFDEKIYLNNDWVDLIMRFINTVVKIAKKKKSVIRMVYGTESHESDQYGIFDIYKMDPEIDFDVIYSVTEETIKGCNILYLPEEYMTDKREYYKEYFGKEKYYDYVFGHGVIQEVMTMLKRQTTKKKRLSTPIFTSKGLSNICKGDVFFGHYHIHSGSDNVHYIGSYSIWQQGEEEDKGFYTFSKDKNKYKKKFIINHDARTYKTYMFGYDYKLFHTQNEDDFQKELSTIKNLMELDKYDYLRFIFNIPEDYENPEFLMNVIKKMAANHKNVNCSFINGYISKKMHADKEVLDEFINKYNYLITNTDTKVEDKISMYIQDKYEKYISPETIKKYLELKIEDILSEEIEETE